MLRGDWIHSPCPGGEGSSSLGEIVRQKWGCADTPTWAEVRHHGSFCSHHCAMTGAFRNSVPQALPRGQGKCCFHHTQRLKGRPLVEDIMTIRTSGRSKGHEARAPNEPNLGELLLFGKMASQILILESRRWRVRFRHSPPVHQSTFWFNVTATPFLWEVRVMTTLASRKITSQYIHTAEGMHLFGRWAMHIGEKTLRAGCVWEEPGSGTGSLSYNWRGDGRSFPAVEARAGLEKWVELGW